MKICGSRRKICREPVPFKLRGAYHKLHSLTQKEREKGVIAASAGNHAQGSRLFLHEDGNQGNDRYAENRSAV